MHAFVKAARARSANDSETWKWGGVSPTLNAFDNAHETRATVLSVTPIGVRRLTPLECERLQGFPDNWTTHWYDFKKGEVVEQKDAPRYKQMGNAVAVPVFEWVMSQLVAVDQAAQSESAA